MAQFERIKVYNVMLEDGLIPLFYNKDIEKTKKVARALAEGGSRILEFTNRGDLAAEVFSELIKSNIKEYPDLITGVGSVMDAPTAALYIGLGANFIVGPSFNKEIALLCNRRKVAYIPGAATVNEISTAEEYGAEIVKIFPGSTVGGPSFVKNILGPMPWSKLMPTGGVTTEESNIKAWFDAGVVCIGMGSNLVNSKSVSEGKFDEITGLTSEVLKIIKNVRKK
ncbi:MAG TPA: bifunctional 4-hydroxy-2-oxoglutarate aldolase/2-dehydro-3-deoxy-phosphogluconate aldolase [Candidatus Humimicrobiaceae bacterium]|nr:bifunctional 4-hydroxy-2-oxoglutarate aldolase/2-dehydro-3-deoxy-phosphogluconate aldolase [Candidatus Humimicrobiaceae bacterium]